MSGLGPSKPIKIRMRSILSFGSFALAIHQRSLTSLLTPIAFAERINCSSSQRICGSILAGLNRPVQTLHPLNNAQLILLVAWPSE